MASTPRKRYARESGGEGGILEFMERYPDEESCERELMAREYREGWSCPRCGCRTCSPVSGRPHQWQCTACSRQFSVTAGTPMAYTKVPLRKWFWAMWAAGRTKRMLSAAELARTLEVNERTAQRMLTRVRACMSSDLERSGCVRRA